MEIIAPDAAASPRDVARKIRTRPAILYPNDAAEPMATSVSMFGAPCKRPFAPFRKNRLWITKTTAARTACRDAFTAGFSRNAGNGSPNIRPIARYIKRSTKPTERNRLLRSRLNSVFTKGSSSFAVSGATKPYPAAVTAAAISASEASPSTPSCPLNRFTAQEETPGTAETAFSTRALHAAQLIPVTLYVLIPHPPCRRGRNNASPKAHTRQNTRASGTNGSRADCRRTRSAAHIVHLPQKAFRTHR